MATVIPGSVSIQDNPVFCEVVSSERTYNRHLKAMIDTYQELDLSPDHIISSNIGLIRNLYSISSGILDNIEQTASPELDEEQRQLFAQQRLDLLRQYFVLYSTYLKMHQDIQPLLRLGNLTVFDEAIRQHLNESEQFLRLTDLLIEPVQRGPRYLILLNELIKTHAQPDQFQQQHFEQLKFRLSEGLRQINLLMGQYQPLINHSLDGEPKLALIFQLLRYKERRSQRPEFDNFFRRGGVPKSIKLRAAEKAAWILNGHKETLSANEFHALTQGRLGRLMKSWSYQVEQDGVTSMRNFFVDEDPNKTAIKELVGLLEAHREKLSVRRSNYSRLDIFHSGYNKEQKIAAITKLLRDRVESDYGLTDYELTEYDIEVLQNGTTGKIIREWNKKYHSNAFSLEDRISPHEYLSDDDDDDDTDDDRHGLY